MAEQRERWIQFVALTTTVLALESRTPEGRAQAEKLAAEQAELKRHGGSFGLAVMLLQIAIMMSSVGALIKKPVMWWAGLVFGLGGLAYMANGFSGLWWGVERSFRPTRGPHWASVAGSSPPGPGAALAARRHAWLPARHAA